MALLKKNPNEALYPNGKKPFMSVIKNEGSPDALICKVEYEDFNENSKLIVGEHEEAMFYRGGVIDEIFTGGTFTLSTNNYPFLSRIRNILTDGVSVYNCRIYYINKAHKLDLRWGTDGPVQVVDRKYDIATTLISRGAYTIQIDDSKKFFLKYVGPNVEQLTPMDIASKFRAPLNQAIKAALGKVVKSMDDEIIGICSRQDEIADGMKPMLEGVFEEYGIRLVNFYVEAIEIADDDSRKVLEASRANRASMAINAQGEKAYLDTLGITWGQNKSGEILNNLAKNEGGNSMAPLGASLGFGIAAGSTMGGMASSVLTPPDSNQKPAQESKQNDGKSQPKEDAPQSNCPKCGSVIDNGSKFCKECGASLVKNCPNCGIKIDCAAKFCPECGQRME